MTRERVQVGPFAVDDLTRESAVRAAVEHALEGGRSRFYALHVGGLNHRRDQDFVDEMNSAELVCADGGSVVLLAQLAGASNVERVPTTDVGWDVLRGVTQRKGHPPRVALVGGEPGLAEKAGATLTAAGVADVVAIEHGYHQQWDEVLQRIRESRPDVCIVGMGAPREMMWVRKHLTEIPEALVMTCGGWFGFLAGTESRAPAWLRRSGIEWVARVAQAPSRLGPRYLRGIVSTAALAWTIMERRWRGGGREARTPDMASPTQAAAPLADRTPQRTNRSEGDHAAAG